MIVNLADMSRASTGRTSGDIVIEASAQKIMDQIADLESYPKWAEGVKAVEVHTRNEQGRPHLVTFHVDFGVIKDAFKLDYQWDGDNEVNWRLIEGKVLTKEDGTYTMDPRPDGTVKVIYQIEIAASVPLPGFIRHKVEKKIIKAALEGLKEQVEQGGSGMG
ncbi:MAG: SRPBCC family protein [Candidatus Nanopelagicales bacterium]|nr:SRPBCC family protein [Candidatus Nanopelagicales bacterium]